MKIAIYGAGQGGQVWKTIAEQSGFEVGTFIDDDPSKGFPSLEEYDGGYPVALAIFDNKVRLNAMNKIRKTVRIIHRTAFVYPTADIGLATNIKPLAMVGNNVKVGAACIIESGAKIEHDSFISNGVFIGEGSNLGSNVQIGQGTLIGIGCNIQTGAKIGMNCIISSGSTIFNDVADNAIVKRLI